MYIKKTSLRQSIQNINSKLCVFWWFRYHAPLKIIFLKYFNDYLFRVSGKCRSVLDCGWAELLLNASLVATRGGEGKGELFFGLCIPPPLFGLLSAGEADESEIAETGLAGGICFARGSSSSESEQRSTTSGGSACSSSCGVVAELSVFLLLQVSFGSVTEGAFETLMLVFFCGSTGVQLFLECPGESSTLTGDVRSVPGAGVIETVLEL